MEILLPAALAGSVKGFRYQPVPPTMLPVASLPGLKSESNGPMRLEEPSAGKSSMLQSCGTSSMRQVESSNAGCSASGASACRKGQLESNSCSRPVCANREPAQVRILVSGTQSQVVNLGDFLVGSQLLKSSHDSTEISPFVRQLFLK